MPKCLLPRFDESKQAARSIISENGWVLANTRCCGDRKPSESAPHCKRGGIVSPAGCVVFVLVLWDATPPPAPKRAAAEQHRRETSHGAPAPTRDGSQSPIVKQIKASTRTI